MSCCFLTIFLQTAGSFTELVAHTGTLAKTILIILLVLSVVSWTIMVEKFRFFRSSLRATGKFLKVFESTGSLSSIKDSARKHPLSPEAQVVIEVVSEIEKGTIRDSESLDRFLDSLTMRIVSSWESYLIFLATTATISPFLGLLGTVWGIMTSFLSMGLRGSANLYVVGPGIAEALITTIFGLGAAIPAVIGYNYILRVIRRREDELVEFNAKLRARIVGKEV